MMNELLSVDKSFNEAMFITKVNNIFIKLMNGVMFKDLDNIKHFISDDVYNKYKAIVDDLNKRGVSEVFDELNVKDSFISDARITDDKIVIIVDLISRYMDYYIDSDGNYVTGVNDHRIEKLNRLTFVKDINSKDIGIVRKCPSCGNSIDVNNSGKCSYCGHIYNNSDYDYILSNIVTFDDYL